MKIVSYDEFLKLPNGTVFSNWTPCIVSELYVKRDTLTNEENELIDFYYEDVIGFSINGEDPKFERAVSRDGCFDHSSMYAIYEKSEVKEMIELLLEAMES